MSNVDEQKAISHKLRCCPKESLERRSQISVSPDKLTKEEDLPDNDLSSATSGDVPSSGRIISTPIREIPLKGRKDAKDKNLGYDCGSLYRGSPWDTARWKKDVTSSKASSNVKGKSIQGRDDSANSINDNSKRYERGKYINEVISNGENSCQHTNISFGDDRDDSSHGEISEPGPEKSTTDGDMDESLSEDVEYEDGDSEGERDDTSLSSAGEGEENMDDSPKGSYKIITEKSYTPNKERGGLDTPVDSISDDERKSCISDGWSPSPGDSREILDYSSCMEMLKSDRRRESMPNTGRSLRSRESTPDRSRESTPDTSRSRRCGTAPETGCYRLYTPQNTDVSPSTPYFFNPVILLDRNEILDNVHFLIKERDYYERELDAAIDAITCLKMERDLLSEQLKAALRLNGEKSTTLVKYIVEFHQSILEDGDGQTRILVDRPPVKHCTKTTFCLHECTHPNPPGGKSSTQFKENKSPPRKNYTETRPRGTNRDSRTFPRKVPGKKPNKSKLSSRKLKSKRPVYVQKDLSHRPPWDDSCFFIPKENKHKRKPTEQTSKPQPCTKTQDHTLEKNQLWAHEIIGKSDENSPGPLNIDGIKSGIEDSLKLSSVIRDSDNTLTKDLIYAETKSSALSKDSLIDFGFAKSELSTSDTQTGGMNNNVGDKKFRSKVSSDRTSHNGLVETKKSLNNGAGDHLASITKHPLKERKEIASKPVEEIQRHETASDGVKPRICHAGRPKQNQPFSNMPENKPLSPIPEKVPRSAKRNLTIFPPIPEKIERSTREIPSKIRDPNNNHHVKRTLYRLPPISQPAVRIPPSGENGRPTRETLLESKKTATTKKIHHHLNKTLDRLPPIAEPALRLPPSAKSTKKESKCPRLLLPLLPDRILLASSRPDKAPTPPKAEKPKKQRPFLGKRL